MPRKLINHKAPFVLDHRGDQLLPTSGDNLKTEVKQIQEMVHRPYIELYFDVKAFRKDGRTTGYILHASDGKPFLVKYGEPLIKEGSLHSLIIWLIDPNVTKKDIVGASYVSETFSHFFGPDIDASEDFLELDDDGLVVAEIALEADESGLLHLIADLNYKHVQKAVLKKYYGTHRGEYDFIGRSMIGIAGKFLADAYGIGFLGVKTDKTKGFYWELSDRPPRNPTIPRITRLLGNIKDISARKEIRDNFYINIVKEIAFRRFDPYMISDRDIDIENAWERHCSEIWSIFSDNEPLLSRLMDESGDAVVGGTKEFINQIMVQYRDKNINWFTSINGVMRKLIEVKQTGNKQQRDCIIDEIINLELDPIVKKEQVRLKQAEMNIDIIAKMYEIIGHHNRIFPVFDLGRIEAIEIGIRPHKKAK